MKAYPVRKSLLHSLIFFELILDFKNNLKKKMSNDSNEIFAQADLVDWVLGLKMDELRLELTMRGQLTAGNKDILRSRIYEVIAQI